MMKALAAMRGPFALAAEVTCVLRADDAQNQNGFVDDLEIDRVRREHAAPRIWVDICDGRVAMRICRDLLEVVEEIA